MKYLITGGAGFIGSNMIHMLLSKEDTELVVNLDKLTYAGNLDNLIDIEKDPRYIFVEGDVCCQNLVHIHLQAHRPDVVIHMAAETHVDNSIASPLPFITTNFQGTFELLEVIRNNKTYAPSKFIQVSTDEVYGSMAEGEASELSPLNPSSPYSATKGSADMLALSYYKTFGLPVIVTRASNNYGRFQYPEKLIPLMVANAMEDKPLPMYGNGMQVRDWLYVDDHCAGILAAAEKGRLGEIYNIGGTKSLPNIEVMKTILTQLNKPESLIQSVKDRPGHDVRYAITSEKLQNETGWKPAVSFEEGIQKTIDWYAQNKQWIANCKSKKRR
jgi:dTDP-glucose 4,6-dehydratase